MAEIKLGKYGKWTALVSDEDVELISRYRWTRGKTNRNCDYVVSVDKPRLIMHRLIMGVLDNPKVFVDHKNHNGLDNRRENLRVCTKSENCSNRRPARNSTSKFLGVFKTKHGTYSANIGKYQKVKHLGTFKIEEDAARAYNEAAKVIHGEFANLNKV